MSGQNQNEMMSMSTSTIGKMQIVPQTKLAFLGYVILLIAQIVYLVQRPQSIKIFLPNMVGFIIIAILGLYVVNCSVVGQCNVYAWIVGYLVVALGVVAVVALLYKLMH